MSFTCWNAPNVKYNTLKKQKLNSTSNLINHRKDVWKPDGIPATHHFSGKNHNFNTHAKFILIEQICHVKERLKQRQNFWILTLKTLTLKDLNEELNQYSCVHHFVHLF